MLSTTYFFIADKMSAVINAGPEARAHHYIEDVTTGAQSNTAKKNAQIARIA
jgi:hypothetical protein